MIFLAPNTDSHGPNSIFLRQQQLSRSLALLVFPLLVLLDFLVFLDNFLLLVLLVLVLFFLLLVFLRLAALALRFCLVCAFRLFLFDNHFSNHLMESTLVLRFEAVGFSGKLHQLCHLASRGIILLLHEVGCK